MFAMELMVKKDPRAWSEYQLCVSSLLVGNKTLGSAELEKNALLMYKAVFTDGITVEKFDKNDCQKRDSLKKK